MKTDTLLEIRESIQYALDSIETAKLNGYITRAGSVFFETTVGELRAAKIRAERAMLREAR